mmetsp:Transcript_54375/g.132899  ORF Transcript_54375/g.132899 Transcript_54375/m.132899 type:complete len:202 (-) Transcript_54375:405-1010(-)
MLTFAAQRPPPVLPLRAPAVSARCPQLRRVQGPSWLGPSPLQVHDTSLAAACLAPAQRRACAQQPVSHAPLQVPSPWLAPHAQTQQPQTLASRARIAAPVGQGPPVGPALHADEEQPTPQTSPLLHAAAALPAPPSAPAPPTPWPTPAQQPCRSPPPLSPVQQHPHAPSLPPVAAAPPSAHAPHSTRHAQHASHPQPPAPS